MRGAAGEACGARLEAGDFAVQGCEQGGERAGERGVGVKGLARAIGLGHAHGDEFLAARQRGGELALAFGRRAIASQVHAALGAVTGEGARVDAVGSDRGRTIASERRSLGRHGRGSDPCSLVH
jgi:hypothetical protein